jgi:hypothetical protein
MHMRALGLWHWNTHNLAGVNPVINESDCSNNYTYSKLSGFALLSHILKAPLPKLHQVAYSSNIKSRDSYPFILFLYTSHGYPHPN